MIRRRAPLVQQQALGVVGAGGDYQQQQLVQQLAQWEYHQQQQGCWADHGASPLTGGGSPAPDV